MLDCIKKRNYPCADNSSFFIIAPLGGRNVISTLRSADGYGCEPVVDAAAYSEEHDAYSAEGESQLGVEIALEGGQGRVGRDDVHRLHDEQVVVETHHGVDQGDEHYEICPERTLLGGCHEDKELGEHSGKRRNTCQREQC